MHLREGTLAGKPARIEKQNKFFYFLGFDRWEYSVRYYKAALAMHAIVPRSMTGPFNTSFSFIPPGPGRNRRSTRLTLGVVEQC